MEEAMRRSGGSGRALRGGGLAKRCERGQRREQGRKDAVHRTSPVD